MLFIVFVYSFDFIYLFIHLVLEKQRYTKFVNKIMDLKLIYKLVSTAIGHQTGLAMLSSTTLVLILMLIQNAIYYLTRVQMVL